MFWICGGAMNWHRIFHIYTAHWHRIDKIYLPTAGCERGHTYPQILYECCKCEGTKHEFEYVGLGY